MTNETVNITTRKLAESIPVDPSTVRRWVERGVLKPTAVTPGGHFRFNLEDAMHQLHIAGTTESAHEDPATVSPALAEGSAA